MPSKEFYDGLGGKGPVIPPKGYNASDYFHGAGIKASNDFLNSSIDQMTKGFQPKGYARPKRDGVVGRWSSLIISRPPLNILVALAYKLYSANILVRLLFSVICATGAWVASGSGYIKAGTFGISWWVLPAVAAVIGLILPNVIGFIIHVVCAVLATVLALLWGVLRVAVVVVIIGGILVGGYKLYMHFNPRNVQAPFSQSH